MSYGRKNVICDCTGPTFLVEKCYSLVICYIFLVWNLLPVLNVCVYIIKRNKFSNNVQFFLTNTDFGTHLTNKGKRTQLNKTKNLRTANEVLGYVTNHGLYRNVGKYTFFLLNAVFSGMLVLTCTWIFQKNYCVTLPRRNNLNSGKCYYVSSSLLDDWLYLDIRFINNYSSEPHIIDKTISVTFNFLNKAEEGIFTLPPFHAHSQQSVIS